MQLRAGVQKEVEFASGLFGMPTRAEMDAAHRKIADLERALRAVRDRFGDVTGEQSRPRAEAPAAGKSGAAKKATKPAPLKGTSRAKAPSKGGKAK
jgi:hypothetical protein